MKQSRIFFVLSVLLLAALFCFTACAPAQEYQNGVYAGTGTFTSSTSTCEIKVQVHLSEDKITKIVISGGPTVSGGHVSGSSTNKEWEDGKDALLQKLAAMRIADIKAVDANAKDFGDSDLCISGAWSYSAALVLAVQDAL